MIPAPRRCVVDTNVLVVANGRDTTASPACIAASASALANVMKPGGHVFIDDSDRIVGEYRANVSAKGQPGPGDAFLKWLFTSQYNSVRVTRVAISPSAPPGMFAETPPPPQGGVYDPNDCKFLAVAAAHPDKPPILQAVDSEWWGWKEALAASGVQVHFLCEQEIAAKHAQKYGR